MPEHAPIRSDHPLLRQRLYTGIVVGAIATALVGVAHFRFNFPVKFFVGETPIIVGDGSIRLKYQPTSPSDTTTWDDWSFYPGGSQQADALSWSAPDDNKKMKKIRREGSSAEADCERADHCVLVVNYSDGSTVQIRNGKKDGKGMTLISSHRRGEYVLSADKRELVYPNPPSVIITVASAYVWKSDAPYLTPICAAGSPCQVKVNY